MQFNSSRVNKVLTLSKIQAATSHFFVLVKWKFRWNWREFVADQSRAASAHRFAQSFYHPLVSGEKYDKGTKPHVLNRILCKAAGLNRRPVRRKGVCSDSDWTVQPLQMAELQWARKSLETMSVLSENKHFWLMLLFSSFTLWQPPALICLSSRQWQSVSCFFVHE